ncbi:stretch-activated Ca2+-permeable channel component-domain-containing protein [Microdochium trichocladiopsis]|uniref:Stretch-activated Ca2+-permeable channel component-domain-containing protein n=1 Tax=Microdochium trichocladiopsis TaxID=1682393 RepID=A0A9P8Y9R1_9PEZI|nr:stretch-activated Ca2+-permeable channel component-domain-containing protein [Microdochium trichocladiopsis]KAH7033291.1 stretch-activated Ca2+-permeable channel component-domain-containing protein [Microdochium trichocladiopsis]
MSLSPLQSRLAASLLASLLVFVLYFLVASPQLAAAQELDAHKITYNDISLEVQGQLYEPDFPQFDRSIIGRAPSSFTSLINNVASDTNVQINNTALFVFEISSVSVRTEQETAELRRAALPEEDASEAAIERRQSPRTLYISANTCQQPKRIGDNNNAEVPQLVLYISNSTDNTSPGPDQSAGKQQRLVFKEGAIVYNTTLRGDVYFSVFAPNVAADKFDATASPYSVQVAASIDEPYHSYSNVRRAELVWIDSDASATLLTTKNVTSSPSELLSTPPYIMFAQNRDDMTINGMRNSYCGLSKWAQMRQLYDGKSRIKTGLRVDSLTNMTRQEFYLDGLNSSSRYMGFLASYQEPGSKRDVPGGGGVVLRQTDFETKPDGACTVIFNLTLCDGLQYAAPGNTTLFPDSQSLAAFYDNYTQTMYSNFDKALQQVACDAPPEGQWSLVRNCTDCRRAYKDWLCSVAIPRCEDFSSTDRPNLQMRNIKAPFANGSFVDQALLDKYGDQLAYTSSRNPAIDLQVQPGPYKELLPCDDVCYNLYQSCPAALGFGCPVPGSIGFDTSYGKRNPDGSLSCNYQGSANNIPSAAPVSLLPPHGIFCFVLVVLAAVLA